MEDAFVLVVLAVDAVEGVVFDGAWGERQFNEACSEATALYVPLFSLRNAIRLARLAERRNVPRSRGGWHEPLVRATPLIS